MRPRSKRTSYLFLVLSWWIVVFNFFVDRWRFHGSYIKKRRPFHSHQLFQPNLDLQMSFLFRLMRANLTRKEANEWRYLILSFESEVRVLWNGTKPVLADRSLYTIVERTCKAYCMSLWNVSVNNNANEKMYDVYVWSTHIHANSYAILTWVYAMIGRFMSPGTGTARRPTKKDTCKHTVHTIIYT